MDAIIRNMIITAVHYRNTTVKEIAGAMGMSQYGLYRKIERLSLKPRELEKIGRVLGAELICYYRFPDGSKIGQLEKPVKGPIARKISGPPKKSKNNRGIPKKFA